MFHPLNFFCGGDFILPRQNHHKLIAAVAHNPIILRQRVIDCLRDFFQNLAAKQMTMLIDNALEIIEIEENQ